MPTATHEFSITDFGRAVQPALDSLPISHHRFHATLEHNLTLRSLHTRFSATPNLALVAMPIKHMLSSSNLLAVVECAFGQDRDKLMKKIRSEVEGWPEIVLVVMIIVSETRGYISPEDGSPTWDFFGEHESCLPPDDFLSLPRSIDECITNSLVEHTLNCTCSDPQASFDTTNLHHSTDPTELHSDAASDETDDEPGPLVLDPIAVAGHMWCDISSVEYRVWVKKDGVLNLDGDKAIGVSDHWKDPTIP